MGRRLYLCLYGLCCLYTSALFAYAPHTVTGHIYARGIVLSEDHQAPFWVGYDADGTIQEEFNEAIDQWAPSQILVLGAETLRSYGQLLRNLQVQWPELERLNRQTLQNTTLQTLDQQPISLNLDPDAHFFALRPPDTKEGDLWRYASPFEIVLLQTEVDPNLAVPTDARSLMVDRNTGEVLSFSHLNIGFKTAFYDDYQGNGPRLRHETDTIWQPMPNVSVSTQGYQGASNDQGRYTVMAPTYGCGIAPHQWISAELYSQSFNPRNPEGRAPYFLWQRYAPTCIKQANQSYDLPTPLEALYTPIPPYVPPSAIGQPRNPNPVVDFMVDQFSLNGLVQFDPSIEVSDQPTTYAQSDIELTPGVTEGYDFDQDGLPDQVILGQMVTITGETGAGETETTYQFSPEAYDPGATDSQWLQGVYFSSRAHAEGDPPDLIRLADTTTNFNHEGLLQRIQIDDLHNTDIYTFRESTGRIVAERLGLESDTASHLETTGTRDNQFFYHLAIRGPKSGVNHKWGRFLRDEQGEYIKDADGNLIYQDLDEAYARWQSQSGYLQDESLPKFHQQQADHLRPGEWVRVIAINRPTGYMASARVQLSRDTSGRISIPVPTLTLHPPNLKIWAKRYHTLDDTLKENLISQEGAALESDHWLAIYTQWLDHDHTPLPQDLKHFGFTGRVARITDPNRLAPATPGTDYFPVKPGTHLQVVRLPNPDLTPRHIYIQVAGLPLYRSPKFNSAPGQHADKLYYRAQRYVPIQVPVWNEALSQTTHSPQYHWPYRPKLQVTTWELEMQAIRDEAIQTPAPDSFPTDLPSVPGQPITEQLQIPNGNDLYTLLYNLSGPDQLPLDLFQGDKEIVLSINGQELIAFLKPDGSYTFNNPALISQLTAGDIMLLQLYQNGDDENILWETMETIKPGLQVISSQNLASRLENSFIITPDTGITLPQSDGTNLATPQAPITVDLIGNINPGSIIQWEITALSAEQQGGFTFTTGSVTPHQESANIQDGIFTSWRSKPTNAPHHRGLSIQLVERSPQHLPSTYCDNNTGCGGTLGYEEKYKNPRHAYHIQVTVQSPGAPSAVYEKTIQMDDKDLLRQEYINHLQSTLNHSEEAANLGFKGVRIPTRTQLVALEDLPVGKWVNDNYPYNHVLNDGMIAMWHNLKQRFSSHRTANFIGFNQHSFTVPDHDLVLTSSYRNPERNEYYKGATGSRHMKGRAIDVAFAGLPVPANPTPENVGPDRGILFGALWRLIRDRPELFPRGDRFTLEGIHGPSHLQLNTNNSELLEPSKDRDGDNRPDEYELSFHLHIQDDS